MYKRQSYLRDFTSAREELLRPTLFERQDVFGNLVRDPVLESPPTVDREGAPSISPEYYELETFTTGFTFAATRTRFSLSAGRTDRDYELATSDTKDVFASASVSRDVSQRTSAYVSLSWTDHEELALEYDEYVAALGGSYQLGVRTEMGMRLAHLERDADLDAETYDENSFSIYFTTTF